MTNNTNTTTHSGNLSKREALLAQVMAERKLEQSGVYDLADAEATLHRSLAHRG